MPVLTEVDYPLLVAGHTAALRDELGEDYRAGDLDVVPDLTWKISLDRALAVYQYLVQGGVSPDNLRLEAFGQFSPHYNNSKRKERLRNRRVDIVLDKRAQRFAQRIDAELGPARVGDDTYEVDGFVFELDQNQTGEQIPEPGSGTNSGAGALGTGHGQEEKGKLPSPGPVAGHVLGPGHPAADLFRAPADHVLHGSSPS